MGARAALQVQAHGSKLTLGWALQMLQRELASDGPHSCEQQPAPSSDSLQCMVRGRPGRAARLA